MWGRAAMSKRRSAPPGKGRGWRSSSSPSQDLRPEIVHLVQQRDAIQTAKLVASIDQVSQGRFLFGVGGGWNQDEMEDHGTVYATRFKRVRESIEAMKEIWTKEAAKYHGEFVNFAPMVARPKPVQKPHPPIYVGAPSRTVRAAR